jgi:hypothetical protein
MDPQKDSLVAEEPIQQTKNNISYQMLHQLLKKNRESFQSHVARVTELQELIQAEEQKIFHYLEEENRLLALFRAEFCCSAEL